jgi:hypothetical protein
MEDAVLDSDAPIEAYEVGISKTRASQSIDNVHLQCEQVTVYHWERKADFVPLKAFIDSVS